MGIVKVWNETIVLFLFVTGILRGVLPQTRMVSVESSTDFETVELDYTYVDLFEFRFVHLDATH